MRDQLLTIFGGSGFIGRHVVREAAKRGYRVRAAVRKPHLAHFLRPLGDVGQIQIVQANLRHRASIAEAVKGADAVVNLVGILHQAGRPHFMPVNGEAFFAVHAQGARNIAELAAAAGASRFVHVSAIGADPASPSLYARSKAEGERLVREAFPDAVVLRPSIVFGPKDEFFNRFASMARLSPALPLIGFGKTKFQPVYVDDVADATCAALDQPETAGRTYELGGPSVYSFRELMELMLSVIERRRWLAPVPFPVAGLIGLAGQTLGRLAPGGPPLTEDQVALLKRDNVVGADGEENTGRIEDLGVRPQTVEAILPTYLERFRRYGQFEPNRVG
ncbi:MAG: complex I NDUFA9 subunit family protein [Pseudomonadota bacterium]